MVKLKRMIKNACEDDRTLATKLAKHVGFKNPTALYKFLNEDDKETDFDKVLKMVQYLFPDNEQSIMSEYIMTLNPNKRCARESLEYAYINKNFDLFEWILDKLKNSSNKESKEWASVYQIDYDVANGKIDKREAIDLFNNLTISSPEMSVFSKIAQYYIYHGLRLIDTMAEMSILIEINLDKLKDGYIHDIYECRYNILIANVHLHKSELKQLRKNVTKSLDNTNNDNLMLVLYHLKSKLTLFTDYEETYDCLMKALLLARKTKNDHWENEIKKSINFLNSNWYKKMDFIDVKNDEESLKADRGFNKLAISVEEGLEVLNSVDDSDFTDVGKGFYYYYLGRATNDKDYFYDSIEHFNNAGEKFYKKAPIEALRKLGENERALRIYAQ